MFDGLLVNLKIEQEKLRDELQSHVKRILEILGQDLTDDNLIGTPKRVAKYLEEFLLYEDVNIDTTFEAIETDQMVIVKGIPFWSLCSHHMLPFFGEISVGYIAQSKILGLSKIPRICQKHSHKLQTQEKLAHDIANELQTVLDDALGFGVYIVGQHTCMQMRGIKSKGEMITSVMRGVFLDNKQDSKQEFLMLVK